MKNFALRMFSLPVLPILPVLPVPPVLLVKAPPILRILPVLLALLVLSAAGCSQKPAPVAASSGDVPAYAEHYPARLADVRIRFVEEEARARSTLGEFRGYPDAVPNTDFAQMKEVVTRADHAGRSSAYAEASLESESVHRFFVEEKDPLRQKVAGAVIYAAKQKECAKECTDDLGGSAVVAMERSVDKQLEERLRRQSDAQRYMEDHEDELGKANLEVLQKQADAIARTSHVAFVRLELYRRELEELLADASSVGSTLDRTIKESDAVIADANSSKSRKAGAERHKAAADDARRKLDGEVEQEKGMLKDMDQRIAALQKEYSTAFDALVDDLDRRAKAKAK